MAYGLIRMLVWDTVVIRMLSAGMPYGGDLGAGMALIRTLVWCRGGQTIWKLGHCPRARGQ
ncbi:unnamed protein product [Staurois parvus]|uniref:Uncharacterized protein n=1 Tax=Staurois parvus TaxID=386267 RepID=A0ABN9AFC1_9NEOB|nr:unnamed protein product [Staurois parvus]